jgi:hypothetical protein
MSLSLEKATPAFRNNSSAAANALQPVGALWDDIRSPWMTFAISSIIGVDVVRG